MAFNSWSKLKDNEFICDTRESPKRLKGIELYCKRNDMVPIREALVTGDYANNYCVVELKAGTDFASSIVDGRIRKQVDRLLQLPQPVKVVLLTGRLINPKYSRIHPNAITGFISSMAAQGISVVKVEKKQEIYQIISLMKKSVKYNGG
jgi:ERCC4-type nuclease